MRMAEASPAAAPSEVRRGRETCDRMVGRALAASTLQTWSSASAPEREGETLRVGGRGQRFRDHSGPHLLEAPVCARCGSIATQSMR